MASAADPSAGDALLAALSFAGAVEAYTAALDKTSDDAAAADLLCRRSAAHAALGTKESFEAAAADGLAAVTRNPGLHLGYFRAGVALRSLCRFSDAEKFLQEGLSRAPDPTLFQEAIEELAKIRAVETEAGLEPAVAAREADRFRELEEWLLRGGGSTFPALYMRRYEDSASNRGVHARVDIPPDTEVMAIGREFLITVEMGQACPIGRKIAAAGRLDLSAAKHCYLAIFVLWDRLNEASFFQPYYRILPETYPNMPIFWSPDELKFLEGSYMLTQIEDRKQHIFQDYETLCCVAPELREIADLEAFSWARMMVASRNFGIAIGTTRTDALVPLADMLNHFRPRQTKWAYDNKRSAFLIHSLTALHAGQQVYDSYGKKCNSRFLLNYGFAVDHNCDDDVGQNHNEVRLLLSLLSPDADPWFQTKVRMLAEDPVARPVRVSTFYDNDSTQEAFSFLRFVHARAHEMTYLPAYASQLDFDWTRRRIEPISIDNELRVLGHLAALCQEQLGRYPTTLEQDVAEIESNVWAFGSNKRNALILLRGEKEVCHFYVRLRDEASALVAAMNDAPPAALSAWASDASNIDIARYLDGVVMPLLRQRQAGKRANVAGGTMTASEGAALVAALAGASVSESSDKPPQGAQ